MIKLAVLTNPQFQAAFNRLLEASLSGKTMLSIKRKTKIIQEENELYHATRKAICEEYTKRDKDGKAVIVDDHYDIRDECKQEFNAKLADLSSAEVEIGPKIPFKDVEAANLTAKEFIILEDLIEDPSEAE